MDGEWSIQQLAKLAGTTSRTLRHYGEIGLLAPSRIGANGYRYYDAAALRRLQRILLLRELGLGLPQIADVLARTSSEGGALRAHLTWPREEQERLSRQITAVSATITALEQGGEPMAEEMFDGFDHTQHRAEVERRWGAQVYADGDAWWRGMGAHARKEWQRETAAIGRAWTDAAARGVAPDSAEAQELARRHVAWLTGIPSTPAAAPGGDVKGYVLGLGEMYVADERFAANYGGRVGARLVRDALRGYVDAHL